jgi:hypothetical protein
MPAGSLSALLHGTFSDYNSFCLFLW